MLVNGHCERCAGGSDRELLRRMLTGVPAPEPRLPSIVAVDPFVHGKGASPIAVRVLAAIRIKHAKAKSRAEAERYRQAHPEAVAEVLAEGPPVPVSEPLNLPSIPPGGGDPDPALAGVRPPLRSSRMARRADTSDTFAGVGQAGRVDHVAPTRPQDRNPWSASDAGKGEPSIESTLRGVR
jgi:hypothetical protein